MKLYFSPGACSLSPHIVLHEAGLNADYQQVDTRTKEMVGGGDLRTINPKGTVPTLQLDDGTVLTEGAVIVQYLADQAPGANLAPPQGSLERYRLQEWLNYIASELHTTFGQMFSPTATDASRQRQKELLAPKFDFVERSLADKPFLMGETFTVADAYLATVLTWSIPTATDLSPWPALKAYHGRMLARPAVRTALREEGLIDQLPGAAAVQ
jgi:glutathione S-transferase